MIAWRNRRYGKFEPKEESISDVYEFRVEGKTATLILKTFNRQIKDRFKIKPKKLYKDIFRTLKEKEVEHLILDMRDNTGGRREYAWNLLPYLLKKQQNGVVYKNVSWKGKESKNSFPKKSKWAFEGQIYVLTNANTFSNGSVVSVYAKEYGKAIVIGEETGSRYEGFAAGSTQYVTLPHTKIRVGIPRYLFKTMQSSSRQQLKNRGVIPDYPINYTMEDLIQKRDKAMEMAKSLIKENLNRQTSEN